MTRHTGPLMSAVVALASAHAFGGIEVGATTTPGAPLDAGEFAGGSVLRVCVSGIIDLGGTQLLTHPDGSLAAPVTNPQYLYFNVGAAGYPTVAGGDGINHFPGGGGNYDVNVGLVPLGKPTTDTTDPDVIRGGAICGTFVENSSAADWFEIGFGAVLTVPGRSAHLRLAINDTYYPNNSGAYSVTITELSSGACIADLDGNGNVDGADLAQLLGLWGDAGPADFDCSGATDGADLTVLLGLWGPCTG